MIGDHVVPVAADLDADARRAGSAPRRPSRMMARDGVGQHVALQLVRDAPLPVVGPGTADHGADLFGQLLGQAEVLLGEPASRPAETRVTVPRTCSSRRRSGTVMYEVKPSVLRMAKWRSSRLVARRNPSSMNELHMDRPVRITFMIGCTAGGVGRVQVRSSSVRERLPGRRARRPCAASARPRPRCRSGKGPP